jgi:hypothetical protein
MILMHGGMASSTSQTFRFASISGDMIVAVMADAATGAIATALILYFAPSLANDFVNPIRLILAAL